METNGTPTGLADRIEALFRREVAALVADPRFTALETETAGREFVPEAALGDADPPVRLAHELVDGARYGILLTGGNGLYRYDLNDVVEVQGFHGCTPRLAFIRKGRDVVSVTGEKVHLNQIQAAVEAAAGRTRLPVWQFRLVPDVEAGRHDLLVEWRGAPPADDPARAFLVAVDDALGRLNIEYAAKRASRRLAPPRLHHMRGGWSERQCRAEFARGRRDLQHKWTAIAPAWDATSRAEVVRSLDLGPTARADGAGSGRRATAERA